MKIARDDLRGPEVAALLQQHLDEMALHSPPESIHALDLAALREPEIKFWCLWDDKNLAGCGALRTLDHQHGEIKSMRTANEYLRRGVAAKLLNHIIDSARETGLSRLSLETGSMQAFEPARLMYSKFGFELCEPFGDYALDENSLFMTRTI